MAFDWPDSLAARLGLAINGTLILVMAGFGFLDYQRERRVHLSDQIERLRQQGHVLRVAQNHLTDQEFQSYIDSYCRQMEQHISPRHHIIVLSPGGYIIARAHGPGALALERGMVQVSHAGSRYFTSDGNPHLAAGVEGAEGTTIVVSQSMAPIQRVLRRLAVSRAVSIGLLSALLLVVINVLLLRWVRRPIQALVDGVQSISSGEFDRHVEEKGSQEFRRLAGGFNEMAHSLHRADQRRRHEMDTARQIHFGLLPSPDTKIEGASWAAQYIPAEMIGGDYYDIMSHPDGRQLIVIADVCGHGVSAALISSMVKALLRQGIRRGLDLSAAIKLLDHELSSLTGTQHYVTFLAILYTPTTGHMEYINCGHEPGVIIGAEGQPKRRLTTSGLPLGILADADRVAGESHLEPGDRLYLWTDGLVELPDPEGRMLERQRLSQFLESLEEDTPREAVDQLMVMAHHFHGRGTFPDDATLVTLWRDAESLASRRTDKSRLHHHFLFS